MAQSNEPDRTELLEQITERLHIMQAIDDALGRWPEVSALAWEADTTDVFVAELASLLQIDEKQATAVADQQLRRTTRNDRAHIRSSVDQLRLELAEYTNDPPSSLP